MKFHFCQNNRNEKITSFILGNSLFFYKEHFYKQHLAEIGKKISKTKQHPEAELSLFENFSLSSYTLSSKNNRRYSKKFTKDKCICRNEVIWLMTIKMRLKMKKRSHRCDKNRHRQRLRHKYTKYKMCFSIMMVIYITQHLSNIWSSIHEEVKQHWIESELKKALLKKKACISCKQL